MNKSELLLTVSKECLFLLMLEENSIIGMNNFNLILS